jgi:hypothetical protein
MRCSRYTAEVSEVNNGSWLMSMQLRRIEQAGEGFSSNLIGLNDQSVAMKKQSWISTR